jgi:dihydroorotate dehydrogenase (NAD+) catalytic subunit
VAGVKRSLAVELAGLRLPTPVVVAAGCGGTGREFTGLVDQRRIGGVVSRTVTVAPRAGAPTPRIAETPAGIVWETGLQNPGIEVFVRDELPRLARSGMPVIVSIGGGSLEEFVRLTSVLQGRPEVAALEVHLSGPDEELDRPVLGAHAERVTEIVGAVARLALAPVFAKLPGGVGEVVPLAIAAARAGASGLTLSASPPAFAVDAGRLRADLGAGTGWLSGPVLKPLTLRAVLEVARALPEVPLFGCGGIRTGVDAAECLLAGASAVQIGTATLIDPAAPVTIARELARFLTTARLTSPAELRGRLRVPAAATPRVGVAP